MRHTLPWALTLLLVASCGDDACPPEGFDDFFTGDILITLTRGDSSENDDFFDASVLVNDSPSVGSEGEERYLVSLGPYCDVLLGRGPEMCSPTNEAGAVFLEIVEERNCNWTTADGARAEWTIDSSAFFWGKDRLDILAMGPVTYTTPAGVTESGSAMYRFFGTSAF